ncbi:MAG TPA: plastocyanin/azurin family copper-binding protein [Polyangiaceae bacterium]
MRKLLFLSCLTAGLSAALAACSSNDAVAPVTDSGTDTATPQDSGKDTGAPDSGKDSSTPDGAVDSGADVDAGPQPVNDCTVFVDFTAADAGTPTITGPSGALPAQYAPNCIKVKAGASVTWNSTFASHPLMPSGGDAPNPITLTSTGTTKSFAFPTAGTYGFACQFHSLSMFGAVWVVP